MQQKRPTILDVAHRAKVAVGTVSNVLNGTVPVSESRRRRVAEAIAELGYSQNLLAQGLRRRLSPMVGVCVPHTSVAYFAALVDAFEEVASDRGFKILQAITRQDPERELEKVRALLRYHVGGIILIPSMRPEATLDLLAKSGTPVVIVDRPVKADLFDEVTFDNEGAMFDAARRLIALGHRRILFIVRQPNLITTRQRIAGLRKAAAQCPEPAVAEVCEAGVDEVALTARLAAEFRKPDPPTAIVASNSANAAWLLRALKLLGIRQPQDVSVLAFDEPEWADLVEPGLSVVRQPTREIARAAWELLVGRMSDRDLPVRHLELEAETVIRGSVAPLLRRRDPAGPAPIAAGPKPAAAAARTERRAARGERLREA